MDDKLRSLISGASGRMKAAETTRAAERRRDEKVAERQREERIAEQQRDERKRMDEIAESFKWNVHTGLGADVISALGPVTFADAKLEPSMAFQLEGRTFKLKAVGASAALAQLEEAAQDGFSYTPLQPQFSLVQQPSAQDIFLDTLGRALSMARP
ncbi:MAG: hypothetical protein ABSF53_19690 [Terracidiphilus sp.]